MSEDWLTGEERDLVVSMVAGPRRTICRKKLALARDMRKEPTPAERCLWDALRHDALGVRFRRQHCIGPFIADFYCARARLVVEVDGGVHERQREQDAARDAWMRAHGLRVLRVTNEDVLGRLDQVLGKIITLL